MKTKLTLNVDDKIIARAYFITKADLTLFLPNAEYELSEQHIYSKSKNNAFIGKKLKGQTLGIINGNKVFLK